MAAEDVPVALCTSVIEVEAGAVLVVPLPAPEDAPGAVAYDQRNSGPAFAGRRVALQRVGRTREEDILADLAAGDSHACLGPTITESRVRVGAGGRPLNAEVEPGSYQRHREDGAGANR
jgi:hypothetical protein